MKPNDFIQSVYPSIKKVAEEMSIPVHVRLACITQAALETGWGSSSLMIKAHALFGIKATKTWKGKVFVSSTKEVFKGVEETTKASFRAYDAIADSIRDYFKLMSTKRYSSVLKATSAIEALKIIASSGYATDPKYLDKCLEIYEAYVIGAIPITKEEFKKEPTPVADIDQLARDVLKGKYGNGEQRKKLLGANYAAVQHRVNILLRGGK